MAAMMFVLIVAGALLTGGILQDFRFALLGAFLGYLVARINQLSKNISVLNGRVQQLKNRLSQSQQTRDDLSAGQNSEDILPEKVEKISYKTHSTVQKSAQQTQLFESKRDSHQSAEQRAELASQNQPVVTPREQRSESLSISQPPVKADQEKKEAKVDIVSQAITFISNYFTQGNIVVRVGAVILFFGVAFLLKYAAENTNISMEVRLISVATAAIALLFFGWRFREKNQGYGLILQGVAVGILYLTLLVSAR
jgi:uncharacterized membrane protein